MANYYVGTAGTTPISRNSYSVTTTDPTDVFSFDVFGSNQNINLNLHNIRYGDADIRLYRDNNYNGVVDASDTYITGSARGGTSDDSVNVSGLSGGRYLAQVYRYSGTAVYYDLDISTARPSNLLSREVNVGALTSDRNYGGSISNYNTADVYSFSLGFYAGVNINLTGLSNDADIRLIRDNNNNGIVDSGEVVGSSTRGGTLSDSIRTDLSGNYFLQVYQYSGSTGYTLNFDHFTTTYA
ncbi:hypothetical protein [Thermocoleostomius sinensis]|jgi:hypothetical protein|uniref:Peptidase C-terminal archaeal/bacterial domain-containing protein n=1 Tax=Thermocoleostomius sinensis A174 TaxID=2016057 RepID=A0A9E9C6M8_9CYAN|nr:hypothetical protein [Thermocoleostomius sinensis]WAL59419.1 hypothetical protein OXH18_19925 [Thermocoleostomius sinensis A174]